MLDKKTLLIIALAAGLFIAAQYIILDSYVDANQRLAEEAYRSGYDAGLGDAAATIYQETEGCRAATVTIYNLTKNIIDQRCAAAAGP